MFIIMEISGCIIIYLFIFIQHKSNTFLDFIPNYNSQCSNNNVENNKNDNSLKNEIEKLKKDINKLNNENFFIEK